MLKKLLNNHGADGLGEKNCSQNTGESTCPTCGNILADNTLLRCPRCFSSLIKMGCEGCSGCSRNKARH